MASESGMSGAGGLYEHTAEGERAAREDVVIPRPDGDVVVSWDEPRKLGETLMPTGDDTSSGDEGSSTGGNNEMPSPGDAADTDQPENYPGR